MQIIIEVTKCASEPMTVQELTQISPRFSSFFSNGPKLLMS